MHDDSMFTKRFMLRSVCMNDSQVIYSILKDPETTRYLNMNPVQSIEDANEIVKDYLSGKNTGEKYPFAILDKETGEFMGVFLIKIDVYDEDCFEFTVYLDRKYWNNGIYTEVLPRMEEFAFEFIGTGNLRGFVMQHNKSSSHVLKKSGFSLEKTFRVEGIPDLIESYLMTKNTYCSKNNA